MKTPATVWQLRTAAPHVWSMLGAPVRKSWHTGAAALADASHLPHSWLGALARRLSADLPTAEPGARSASA